MSIEKRELAGTALIWSGSASLVLMLFLVLFSYASGVGGHDEGFFVVLLLLFGVIASVAVFAASIMALLIFGRTPDRGKQR